MPLRIGGFDLTDIRRHSGGLGLTAFPFQIIRHVDTGGNPYVTVRPGTVSLLLPDNIYDKIYIADTGTFYIKLFCQSNGKVPTFLFLGSDSEPIDNNDNVAQGSPPPNFEIILGVVKDKKVYQVIYDNLVATPKVVFLESKTTGLLSGQEPFTRWWAWQVV